MTTGELMARSSGKSSVDRQEADGASRLYGLLTQIALILCIAVAIGRATFLEVLRETGNLDAPRGAGPATGLLLDLLTFAAALLVLLRRVLDRQYVIRWHWSHVLLGLLAVWALLSTLWSADTFAALVTSSHFLAAAVLVWTMTQLVRSWTRLRIVLGASFGLFLILLASGVIYRTVDLPDLWANWQRNRLQTFRDMGIEPDSYPAQRFDKKVRAGEMFGFYTSPNTFAAMLVMLGVIGCGGAMIQRKSDNDEWGWAFALGVPIPFALWILYYTQSRTAWATAVLAIVAMLIVWKSRALLGARSKSIYWLGFGVLCGGIAAIVAHGLYHGTLFHDSLNFRWRYWTGAWRVFVEHPVVGVGWSNFGDFYLAKRLPVAAEEIQDPHNFLVRAFTELGIVGGVLMVAWIARCWWEWTRPIVPPAPAQASGAPREPAGSIRRVIGAAVGITACILVLNILASIDWTQVTDWVLLEILRRLLYGLLMVGGIVLITLKSSRQQELDDRPAPWLLYGTLIALGVFLIQNLIDFAMFETGPMMVMALLAGSALGVRYPSVAGRRRRTAPAIAALGIGAGAWVAALVAIVIPIVDAENQMHEAYSLIRQDRVAEGAGVLKAAARRIEWNADYAFRASRALIAARAPAVEVHEMLASTLAANPMEAQAYALRANFDSRRPNGDFTSARADFEKALALDPNNVSMRLDYAEMLERAGDAEGAKRQYRTALDFNDQLSPDEPKRMPESKLKEIEQKAG